MAFGTIDSWLIWNLTQEGAEHVIAASNASRTMLMNLHRQTWDEELLEFFQIPASVLPEMIASGSLYCTYGNRFIGRKYSHYRYFGGSASGIIWAILFWRLAQQKTPTVQAVLCCSIQAIRCSFSKNKLLTTLAWQCQNQTHFALEGSVFMAGAVVQWLRDGLGIYSTKL